MTTDVPTRKLYEYVIDSLDAYGALEWDTLAAVTLLTVESQRYRTTNAHVEAAIAQLIASRRILRNGHKLEAR